jgi:hypothetical protein
VGKNRFCGGHGIDCGVELRRPQAAWGDSAEAGNP